jgi:hypothetical protein
MLNLKLLKNFNANSAIFQLYHGDVLVNIACYLDRYEICFALDNIVVHPPNCTHNEINKKHIYLWSGIQVFDFNTAIA